NRRLDARLRFCGETLHGELSRQVAAQDICLDVAGLKHPLVQAILSRECPNSGAGLRRIDGEFPAAELALDGQAVQQRLPGTASILNSAFGRDLARGECVVLQQLPELR